MEQLRQLANDILDNKIFSSIQVYDLCEGNDQAWLNMMRYCFRNATKEQAVELEKYMNTESDILWYEYLDKKVNDTVPPQFDSVQFCYGDDLSILVDLLKKEARNRALN